MESSTSIAVTGANGFFGWHFRCRLRALLPSAEIRVVNRSDFDDGPVLGAALEGVDAVVHLAGANRGSDDVVYQTNIGLAAQLVRALEASGGSPSVVYASTTHAGLDTPYGRSKARAGVALAAWALRSGARAHILRFPNLFGECGRPNYNSAVATFCHDLALGLHSEVNPAGQVELLHVQDACAAVMECLAATSEQSRRVSGRPIAIPEVYGRLERLFASYRVAKMPALLDRLDLQLFNALRTAMFPGHYPVTLDSHHDSRGLFVELGRGHGETQVSFSSTGPGVTRGEHFHLEKIERFIVVRGTAVIRLRRLFTDEVVEYRVSGDQPTAVDMPPLHAHHIENAGTGDLLTVFWANDHFDPAAPDTYPEPVGRLLDKAVR